ncbi:MAG: nicotinate-nucleotide--dimethylbenzimidazole phosphoribosyltransferase [bacterium]|nr:nicotinate-nucleotide--dimethylbenzimidazole phosphoribosyltransferase [bacterium]
MNLLDQTISEISSYNKKTALKAKTHLESLAMPHWALGKIMNLAVDLAGITGKVHPSFEKKINIVMAADHGVTEENISAYPQEVTVPMVYTMLKNGAAINVLANSAGSKVIIVDVGIKSKIDTNDSNNFICRRISNGTSNFTNGPAMTKDQAIKSIEIGIETANHLANKADIFGLGEIGIGNTTSATAILCAVTCASPTAVTGRGTGINDDILENKISVIEKALQVNKPDKNDPIDILQKVGGFEIGAMAGFIIGASAQRKPVIIDGLISTSSALIARLICPEVCSFIIASHEGVEPGHKLMLKHLNKKAYLNLGLRLGEGTGAALMMPLIDSAGAVLNNMFTLEQALAVK